MSVVVDKLGAEASSAQEESSSPMLQVFVFWEAGLKNRPRSEALIADG